MDRFLIASCIPAPLAPRQPGCRSFGPRSVSAATHPAAATSMHTIRDGIGLQDITGGKGVSGASREVRSRVGRTRRPGAATSLFRRSESRQRSNRPRSFDPPGPSRHFRPPARTLPRSLRRPRPRTRVHFEQSPATGIRPNPRTGFPRAGNAVVSLLGAGPGAHRKFPSAGGGKRKKPALSRARTGSG